MLAMSFQFANTDGYLMINTLETTTFEEKFDHLYIGPPIYEFDLIPNQRFLFQWCSDLEHSCWLHLPFLITKMWRKKDNLIIQSTLKGFLNALVALVVL